ncbi:Ku protein [Caldimonas sp. KR1-144]|uniref:non-homologous end joining protein Ku n=1 Tax=Caldimonas sp. KR1-144 TaxID=3400911 RepID=UPI003C12006F
MPRALWKGAISFGLVHVPVAIYPAASSGGIDFDWLDDRSMDPVGYKRVNKRTGKEVPREHIVRGVKHADGEYVLVSDEEVKAAYPRTTQTIELESFVSPAEIPFVLLERPYYLEPQGKGDKVYALLRDALSAAQRVGIARVVIQTREHLAALIPDGALLMLDTLRWPAEIRSAEALKVPPHGKGAAAVKDSELKMAMALIEDMARPWDPAQYEDRFQAAVMALVERKLERGQTERVQPVEEAADLRGSNVVDLTELLKRSLAKPPSAGKAEAKPRARRAAPRRRA